jgi:hypothetical protein
MIEPAFVIPDPNGGTPSQSPVFDESPEAWIGRLWRRLDQRAARIQLYEDYYNGHHRLRFTTLKMRETFGTQFGAFASNYCRLVVDAVDERLRVQGFLVLDDDDEDRASPAAEAAEEAAESPDEEAEEEESETIGDDLAWQIWRRNDLEEKSRTAHVEALVNEEAYIIVWADPDDPTMPQITVESPFEVILDCDPANRKRRRAALKRWVDPDDLRWRAVLYLPDGVYKYISVRKAGERKDVTRAGFWEQWQPAGDPAWPLPNPLKVVPVLALTNTPRMGGGGDSEIRDAIPVNDALNKTIIDMLVASEFVAFPQRVIIGAELPTDENGQPIEAFKAGVNRYWFLKVGDGMPAGSQPAVTQFPASDLTGYSTMIDKYIGIIGSLTKTPKHYLVDPGGGTNFTGETVQALEAGLTSKAKRKTDGWGPIWAEAMALAFLVVEQAGGDVPTTDKDRILTNWAHVEARSQSQLADMLVKLVTLDIPTEQLWADFGYTPQQIKRFRKMRATSPAATLPARITEPVTPQQLVAQTADAGAATPPAAIPPAATTPPASMQPPAAIPAKP